KAAEEMLRRAAVLVGTSCERVAGGTFHSFANSVLRRNARRIGFEPNFTILDRSDSEDAINLLRARAGLDRKERRFPRKNAIGEILSMAVNRSMAVPDVLTASYPHLYDHLDDLVRLGEQYARYKREKNLVDYDDLLGLLRDVVQRILELREEGVPLDEMAVLFRSSFHSFDLELELQRADIPFVKRGGFKFLETAHVKDVLAHLRIVANPRDAVSWHRVLLLLE